MKTSEVEKLDQVSIIGVFVGSVVADSTSAHKKALLSYYTEEGRW